jgi:hypothetical protein
VVCGRGPGTPHHSVRLARFAFRPRGKSRHDPNPALTAVVASLPGRNPTAVANGASLSRAVAQTGDRFVVRFGLPRHSFTMNNGRAVFGVKQG